MATAEGASGDEAAERTPDEAAAPFDAVANLRLLGEVQRRGLEAANLVIARLTERTNAAGRAATGSAGVDPVTAMAEAFVESVAAATAAMTTGVDGTPRPPGAPPGGPASPEVLPARGTPGGVAEVELWLHNYTDDLATGIEIHATELIDAHGGRLPSSRVSVQPDHPFDLSAASSRSVRLTVDLPADTSPGRYRGVVTAARLADLWLVLEVEVLDVDVDGSTP